MGIRVVGSNPPDFPRTIFNHPLLVSSEGHKSSSLLLILSHSFSYYHRGQGHTINGRVNSDKYYLSLRWRMNY